MTRDGRMTTPEGARQAALERRRLEREKRDRQPSVQRRRTEAQQRREEWSRVWNARWKVEWREKEAQPLYEMLRPGFRLRRPGTVRSNSFATMRPRLIIHLEAVVADLDSELVYARQNRRTRKGGWPRSRPLPGRDLAEADESVNRWQAENDGPLILKFHSKNCGDL